MVHGRASKVAAGEANKAKVGVLHLLQVETSVVSLVIIFRAKEF